MALPPVTKESRVTPGSLICVRSSHKNRKAVPENAPNGKWVRLSRIASPLSIASLLLIIGPAASVWRAPIDAAELVTKALNRQAYAQSIGSEQPECYIYCDSFR